MITAIVRTLISKTAQSLNSFFQEVKNRDKFLYAKDAQKGIILGQNITFDKTSVVGDNCIINNAAVINSSNLSNNCEIGRISSIFNTQIGEFSSVGDNCKIHNSVIGNNTLIERKSEIEKSNINSFVTIHKNTWITNTWINSYSYLGPNSSVHDTTIGKFCSIAQNLSSGLGNHPTYMVSTSPVFYSSSKECGITLSDDDYYSGRAKSLIGNDVWIGANVFIKSGLSIGDGAVIAAGSIVTKDVMPYSIVAGVPAKEIRKRFSVQDISLLLDIKWWNWEEAILREALPLMREGNIRKLKSWYDNYSKIKITANDC